MNRRKGVWRRSIEVTIGVVASIVFLYMASASDSSGWTWVLVAAAVVSMLITFGDMRGLADELDNRHDDGSSQREDSNQREYQRLWSKSRIREDDLEEALGNTNVWISDLIENGLGYEYVESALARIESNKKWLSETPTARHPNFKVTGTMSEAPFQSERRHGPLFTLYELRIEAVPANEDEIGRLADELYALDVGLLLGAIARQIESAVPEVRAEVVAGI